MRTHAFLLCAAAWLMISPALAEPPDIEDTDYLTGCLKDGKLLSFEISGWGAHRPCWKHGSDAEWITLPRANQNSQLFTVLTSGGPDDLIIGPADPHELILIKEIGSFRVYSNNEDYCGIAVGPSDPDISIGFPKLGLFPGEPGVDGLLQPYYIDATFDGFLLLEGSWRIGESDEVFYSPEGGFRGTGELLIPRFVFGSTSGATCRAGVTFEYLETALAHTVYFHDRSNDEVTVEYRRDK